MIRVTRRSFAAAMGAVALLPASAALAQAAKTPASTSANTAPPAEPAAGYQFFDPTEARFIEAACARLIPADDTGPGAVEVGACFYLDAQLAGPWGAGELLHRTGAWQPGTLASSGTPARFVRTTLEAIDQELRQRGTSFDRMPRPLQDSFLRALRRGDSMRDACPRDFFDLLLQLTVEGFFSAPYRGLTRERIPWQLSGFPGAFAGRLDFGTTFRGAR